jgi:hypothetical protein
MACSLLLNMCITVDRPVGYDTYQCIDASSGFLSWLRSELRSGPSSISRPAARTERPFSSTTRPADETIATLGQRRPVNPWRRRKAGALELGITLRLRWRKIGQPRRISEPCPARQFSSARHCRLPKTPIYLTFLNRRCSAWSIWPPCAREPREPREQPWSAGHLWFAQLPFPRRRTTLRFSSTPPHPR